MLARGQAAPLRFLLAVLLLWVTVRGAVIEGWAPFTAAQARYGPPPGSLMLRWPGAPAPLARLGAAVERMIASVRPLAGSRLEAATLPATAATTAGPVRADGTAPHPIALASARPAGERSYARATGEAPAAAIAGVAVPARRPSRWSGSAWAFVRGGGRARPLSSDGQIGGGQAGARALYRLDGAGALAASARVSRTIGGPRQAEAAFGLDWRPLRAVPVHLTIERRVALDSGGRNAFTAGIAGGVYDLPLAPGWRLDGYGEAGVVGARRRDLYADGAVRAGREIGLSSRGATLTLGAGLWGAAQPRAERLDIGPSAVARLPVDGRTVAVALDYRARLAGDARPHSGVALTMGVDF